MARPLSPRQLVALLDQSGGGRDAAICFDADGTLWSGDVGEDMFEFAVHERLLHPASLGRLQDFARELELPVYEDANEQGAGLLDAFHRGTLPEREACIVMAVAFAGWRRAELSSVVQLALAARNLQDRLFGALAPVFEWAKRTRTQIYVVSASPDFVVEVAAEHWGLAPEAIVACTPMTHTEVLHTSLRYELPYGPDKVRTARARLREARWLASFGDSGFDLAMLTEAEIGVVVRPKPSLEKLMPENPSLWLFQEED